MHFHFDIYKSIVNGHREQLMKEASEYRMAAKINYAADRKMKRKMLFRSFFDPGNAD
ncbi:hypothetical protein [Virgibacillus profundi]|uniref:hypothetical protein n=1 Tax=Virgibacillus profundi TaxID=2024555 RepID=UPI0013FDE10D|nr:hypothetical protein [Virgibacillus profundi]